MTGPRITLRDFLAKGIVLNDRGKHVQWCPALEELSRIEDPAIKSVSLCMPRRSGKSTAAAAVALWHAMTTPHAEVVLVAATGGSVEEVFRQKLITSLLADRFKKLGLAADPTLSRIYFPRTNSTILTICPSEANTVGKTITLLLIDECRLVEEETVRLLEPSTFSVGKRIYIGTAGRPRTWWADLFKDPSPSHHARIFASVAEAQNPALNLEEEAEEARRRAERGGNYAKMLYRRDFESAFCELAESPLLAPADIDRASVAPEAIEPFDRARDTVVLAADLSLSRDITSVLALARRADPKLPAGGETLRILEIFTLTPTNGTRVDLSAVEAKIESMWRLYSAEAVYVDQYQAAQLCQRLEDRGCPVKPVAISAPVNQAAFSQLAEALSSGRLRWARHERLERELAGLSIEETASGFRVLDANRRYHRDVSFALALALWGIGQTVPCRSLPVTAVHAGSPAERNAAAWARDRNPFATPRGAEPGGETSGPWRGLSGAGRAGGLTRRVSWSGFFRGLR